MWCPRCGMQRAEGLLICDVCASTLIPETDMIPGEGEDPETEMTHLAVVYNQEKVAEVEETLQNAGIPYSAENLGSIEYVDAYDGKHLYGTDFFVPEERLEDAQEAIEALPEDVLIVQNDEVHEEEGNDAHDNALYVPEKPRKKPGRILLLYLLLAIGLPVLALVILGIVGVI